MAKHTDREKRPKAVEPDYSTVPEPLRRQKHWVLWRYDWNTQRKEWAKVPYQCNGAHAKSNDPATWSTFETAVIAFDQARSKYDGLGFVFSNDCPFVGVDLDDCVSEEDGEQRMTPFASRVMEKLKTYTELSPSLNGIHLIGEADQMDALKTAWNGNKIEVYREGRYFTFTGRSWHETPLDPVDIDKPLRGIIAAIKKPNGHDVTLTIDQRVEMALKDPKTNSLFYGNTVEYGGDDSRADMALVAKMAYYSDGSRDILDAMFRKSKLMRGKWDERHGNDTYGNLTIGKVLANQKNFMGVKPVEQKTDSSYETRRVRRFTVDDLREQVMEFRQSGDSQGVHPGWDRLQPLYRPGLGQLSIVTGEPGSGKSTWVDCLTYNIARRHDWGIVYASFETLPLQRHVLNLCQIHLQKPTFAFIPGAATDDEMNWALDAISPWFHFIMPDDHELDIDSILAYVADDIKDYEISGFVLDPFTELEQNRLPGVSQTEQIEKVLRKLQQFTRHRQIHSWLIAHPTKSADTYRDGRPTMRSISGSANFFNKADFGIVVHRQDDDRVSVFIDKVRFDSNGTKGQLDFTYSKERRAYDDGLIVEEF